VLSAEDEKWVSAFPIKELQKRHHLPLQKDPGRLFEGRVAILWVADRAAWTRILEKTRRLWTEPPGLRLTFSSPAHRECRERPAVIGRASPASLPPSCRPVGRRPGPVAAMVGRDCCRVSPWST
jgi:hypothetical protein